MLNPLLTKSGYRGSIVASRDDTDHGDARFAWQGVKMLTTARTNLVDNPFPLVFWGEFAYS